MQIRSDINYRIERLFREAAIEIPYPQHELRIRQGPLHVDTEDTQHQHDESQSDAPADN
jgi:small-conductance mechanosensitive channel